MQVNQEKAKKFYIYIVFSSTPYKMGGFIRTVTHNNYNHISISLDKEMSQMYSFARLYRDTPFYGGFVKESAARYIIKSKSKKAKVKVCALPVTEEQKLEILNLIKKMKNDKDEYLYNTLSAIYAVFRRKAEAEKAYTCVEFAVKTLSSAYEEFNTKKFYSIKNLESKLQKYIIYQGEFPQECENSADGDFNKDNTAFFICGKTVKAFTELLRRRHKETKRKKIKETA